MIRLKIQIIFTFFLFGYSCVLNAQQNDLNTEIKNLSSLEYEKKRITNRITDVTGATYCSGALSQYETELLEIGITSKRLKENVVQCTVGDFDGNGYLDFAFWGLDKKEKHGTLWSDYENYFVVFFEKSNVINTIKIKTEKGLCLVHYPPQSEDGFNGEPTSKNDSLWTWGTTDDGYDDYSKGVVYIYNKGLRKFDQVKFGE